ncbi:hypothetical protein ACFSM7_00470 [Clavibacter michiganensis subsp. tessellarius]|uniref:hypothetical protein n=1 Tax=Clavibacter tessellarius TaxID=31965 RepID=UPI0036381C45
MPPVIRLTDEPVDHGSPRFSADGTEVLFVASRHAGRDDDLLAGAYAVRVPAPGETPSGVPEVRTVVSHEAGLGVGEAVAVDGGRVYLLAQELGESGVDFVARNTSLYVLDAADAAPRVLTDAETVDLGRSDITVLDRDAVLVLNASRGTVQLLRVTADGAVEALVDDQVEVTGVGVGGGAIVVSLTDRAPTATSRSCATTAPPRRAPPSSRSPTSPRPSASAGSGRCTSSSSRAGTGTRCTAGSCCRRGRGRIRCSS